MSKQDTVTGQKHGENYCYYYLHTNGDLIHKSRHFDISDLEKVCQRSKKTSGDNCMKKNYTEFIIRVYHYGPATLWLKWVREILQRLSNGRKITVKKHKSMENTWTKLNKTFINVKRIRKHKSNL